MLDAAMPELRSVLSDYGLDVTRYAPTLVELFLRQWGPGVVERSAEARAALVGTFSIGETTFMRHPEQFRALRALLPRLARTRLPLRVLSAGCATGEEAYSLAAVLSCLGPSGYELHAWDFNPRAIERAKQGLYRPWSLRGVDPAEVQGWLEPAPCGVAVRDDLKSRIQFRVANLNADPLPHDLDVIFCRNVLLYFRRDLAAQVIARLADSLRVGGVMFLGHYDPPPEGALPLVERAMAGVRYFVRTEAAAPVNATPSLPPPPRAAEPVLVSPDGAPLRPRSADEVLHAARDLSDERRFDDALVLLEELSRDHPLDPRVHVLTALVAEDAEQRTLMLKAARNAVCLEPDDPATNFFLSVAFRRNGELRRAAIHRRIAGARLSPVHYRRGLPLGEGLTAPQLERMIRGIGT